MRVTWARWREFSTSEIFVELQSTEFGDGLDAEYGTRALKNG